MHQTVRSEYNAAIETAYGKTVVTFSARMSEEAASVVLTPAGLAAWKKRVAVICEEAEKAVVGWTVSPEDHKYLLSSLHTCGEEFIQDVEEGVVGPFILFFYAY